MLHSKLAELYFYDVNTGKLAIGVCAIDSLLEQAVELTPLKDVLINKTTDKKFGSSINVEDWTNLDYIAYGHWLITLLGDEVLLQDYVIKNAFNLGLGPSRDRIVHRFGSIWRFREALGIKNSRSAGKYNNWGLADYIDFASKLSIKLGKKPTRNDYIEEIKKNGGPPIRLFNSDMVGGISALNELIGYPNIKAWDNEAFVIWGADVTLANLTISELTQKFVDQLALQDKGPSQKTIYNRFGSFGAYKNLVLQELELRYKHKIKILTKIKSVLSRDGVMRQLEDLNDQEILIIGAKYLLAKIILNNYGYKSLPENLLNISRKSEKNYIKALKQLCKKISNQDIEHTALELDVFDYVYDELADTIASKHRLD